MASKRRLRRMACRRKVALPNAGVAMKVAADMRARGKDVHTYPCSFGRHWHVGRPSWRKVG